MKARLLKAVKLDDVKLNIGRWTEGPGRPRPDWEMLSKAAIWTDVRWERLRKQLEVARPMPTVESGPDVPLATVKGMAAYDTVDWTVEAFKTGSRDAVPDAAKEKPTVRLTVIDVEGQRRPEGTGMGEDPNEGMRLETGIRGRWVTCSTCSIVRFLARISSRGPLERAWARSFCDHCSPCSTQGVSCVLKIKRNTTAVVEMEGSGLPSASRLGVHPLVWTYGQTGPVVLVGDAAQVKAMVDELEAHIGERTTTFVDLWVRLDAGGGRHRLERRRLALLASHGDIERNRVCGQWLRPSGLCSSGSIFVRPVCTRTNEVFHV
jgi:hypothetical protein